MSRSETPAFDPTATMNGIGVVGDGAEESLHRDKTEIETAITKLLNYCRADNWSGYDPYDALNSPIFRILPFINRRLPRLVMTQALKRMPLNLRPLLKIPKTQNPKALALFLSALMAMERITGKRNDEEIGYLIGRLSNLRSQAIQYSCWGYSFPWQGRAVVVLRGAPNLVCTCFVANALLDAFEYRQDSHCLAMALSAAEYIVNELYWSEGQEAGFSYPDPTVRSRVHNANFLAAALLCRVYEHSNEEKYLAAGLRVARYSAAKQLTDGSWYYGESSTQRWIDNFHTGYNLCSLKKISLHALPGEFDGVLSRGWDFYRNHFLFQDGSVAYFHNQKYPIDIHCVAQSILTLLTFRHLDASNLARAHSVLRWALRHMWDERGYFYYRILRFSKNRLSFIRWSQAWMLLAMVMLREATDVIEGERGTEAADALAERA